MSTVRAAVAIAEALFSRELRPPAAERLAWIERELGDFLDRSGVRARLVLSALIWVVSLLAPAVIGRLSLLGSLALEDRVRALVRLEERFGTPLLAVKAILFHHLLRTPGGRPRGRVRRPVPSAARHGGGRGPRPRGEAGIRHRRRASPDRRPRGCRRRCDRRVGSGRRRGGRPPGRGGAEGDHRGARAPRAAAALRQHATERVHAAYLARRRSHRRRRAGRHAAHQRHDGRVRRGLVGPHRRRVLPDSRRRPARMVTGPPPRRALGSRYGALLRGRRARGARRGGARLDALAVDRAVRKGGREARPPAQADAPQHEELPRVRPVQLRLPGRREDERRPDLPAEGPRGGRAHLLGFSTSSASPRRGRGPRVSSAASATASAVPGGAASKSTRSGSFSRPARIAPRSCSSGAAWEASRGRSGETSPSTRPSGRWPASTSASRDGRERSRARTRTATTTSAST